MTRRRALVASAAALLFAAAAWLHLPHVNGPSYWEWPWIRRADPFGIALLFACCAAPAIIGQSRFVRSAVAAVTLAALSAVALQLAAIALVEGGAYERLATIVRDPGVTSYYTAAEQTLELEARQPDVNPYRAFDRLLPFFPLHARTKPLGPVMIYRALRIEFGGAAPLAAGELVALLTAAAVIAMYFAAREVAGERVALLACALLALTPGVALFYPQFDVTYPLFTCGILVTWPRALRGSHGNAIAFGATVFAASLLSYALFVLGAFCALAALIEWRRDTRNVLTACAIAIATIVVATLALQLTTGYDAIATFRSALAQQHELLAGLHRPYPLTIPFDLYDFAVGVGIVPIVAALFFLRRRPRGDARLLIAAGLVMPPLVAVTGLLQAETARVWLFLAPFVVLAAAIEMVEWETRERLCALAAIVVVTISIYANMAMVNTLTGVARIPRIPAAAVR